MKMNSTLISLTLFLSLLIPSLSKELCHPQDKKVLFQIKESLGNPYVLASWTKDSDCCEWYCVKCDEVTHRIINLDVSNDGFHGQIPDSVGDLPYLEELVFRKLPNLTGTIPVGISRLTNVKTVWLSWTSLSGPVPSFLSTLKNLEYLNLAFNSLTGTIPPSLSKLTKLGALHLDRNKLTGNIPESYGEFTGSVPDLYLSHNSLTGTVPKSLGKLDFTRIDLSRNMLEGDASFLFGNKKTAQIIDLSRNMFEFDFSKVEFSKDLIYLDLNHNKLTGSLPEGLASIGLQTFNVSYNQLCGKIPQGGNLNRFDAYAYLHNKCLCGSPLPPCK